MRINAQLYGTSYLFVSYLDFMPVDPSTTFTTKLPLVRCCGRQLTGTQRARLTSGRRGPWGPLRRLQLTELPCLPTMSSFHVLLLGACSWTGFPTCAV